MCEYADVRIKLRMPRHSRPLIFPISILYPVIFKSAIQIICIFAHPHIILLRTSFQAIHSFPHAAVFQQQLTGSLFVKPGLGHYHAGAPVYKLIVG